VSSPVLGAVPPKALKIRNFGTLESECLEKIDRDIVSASLRGKCCPWKELSKNVWYVVRRVEVLKFLDISAVVRPIGIKFCMMVELYPRHGFSSSGGYLKWSPDGGKTWFFGQFVFGVTSLISVINKIHWCVTWRHSMIARIWSMHAGLMTVRSLRCICFFHLTLFHRLLLNSPPPWLMLRPGWAPADYASIRQRR